MGPDGRTDEGTGGLLEVLSQLKIETPPWVFKCLNLNFRHFWGAFDPPPLFGTLSQIFQFFNYDASPNLEITLVIEMEANSSLIGVEFELKLT